MWGKLLFGVRRNSYVCSKRIIFKDSWGFSNDLKEIDAPIEKGRFLILSDYPKTNKEKNHISRVSYANVIGNLMHDMLYTRPNTSLLLKWSFDSKAT